MNFAKQASALGALGAQITRESDFPVPPPPDMSADAISKRLLNMHERLAVLRNRLEEMADALGVPHLPRPSDSVAAVAGESDGWCPWVAMMLDRLDITVEDLEYHAMRLRQFV